MKTKKDKILEKLRKLMNLKEETDGNKERNNNRRGAA
jgi:hypothetical protein